MKCYVHLYYLAVTGFCVWNTLFSDKYTLSPGDISNDLNMT